jgi:dehydrogenase/reductase SDR family member 7B
MRDEGKMMSSEEVADRILKAVKKRDRDMVLTLQGKMAVWVNKLFPSLADKLVYNALAKEKDSPLKKNV